MMSPIPFTAFPGTSLYFTNNTGERHDVSFLAAQLLMPFASDGSNERWVRNRGHGEPNFPDAGRESSSYS